MAFCKDGGKFFIVNLIVDNEEQVAIVQNFWYHTNGWCRYPNTKGTNAIKSRATPNEKWLDYRSSYRKYYDSYNEARPYLKIAQQQSDINTASESELGKGKRKKIAKQPYSPKPSTSGLNKEFSSSDESDSESNASQQLPLIDLPHTLSGKVVQQDVIQQSTFIPIFNDCSDSQLLNEETQISTVGIYNSYSNVKGTLFSNDTQSSIMPRHSTPLGNTNASTPESFQVEQGSASYSGIVHKENKRVHYGSSSEQVNITSGRSQGSTRTGNFDQQILKTLIQIQEEQRKFDAKLTLIDKKVENYKTTTDKTATPDVSELPILIENLETFEENLSLSKAKYNNLVAVVRSIGGTNLGDAVKRTVNRVLHVDAQAKCNWKGQKRGTSRKHGLSSSPITKAIFEGIRQISPYEESTDSDLEFQMKKAVRHAPEKIRKRTRSPSPPVD